MKPSLAIIYQNGMPTGAFEEFANAVDRDSLTVYLEGREVQGPFAGLMWTMPTVIGVFIAHNYFGGMLKELGKDHYVILKAALAKLTQKTMENPRIEPTLFSTPGKVDQDDPFSMGFSVWAELSSNRTAKLLIPKTATPDDYGTITEAFLNFVKQYHEQGDDVLTKIGFDISRRGNPITVAFNPNAGTIQYANPFPV